MAVEAGEDRAGFGDGGLNGGELERGLMARLAVPDFGDPDGVRFARVPGDDVAEASGHRPDAFEQDRDQRIAFAGFWPHLSDQAVHAVLPFLQRDGPTPPPTGPAGEARK